MNSIEERRKKRRRETGEDFTSEILVNQMLDLLKTENFTNLEKTLCDPGCGNGNFLIEILKRKLANGHPPLQALSTIYGVELMLDNVEECRDRLLIELPSLTPEEAKEARRIVNYNIVCHDSLLWNFEEWRPIKRKAKKLFD